MWIGLAIAGATLCGILYAGWHKARKAWKRGHRETVAVRDAILGRDAVVDTITRREIMPALPGIGVRMASQESQMERLTETVELLAKHQATQHELERRVDSIDERVKKLEDGMVERIVNKAESTQALRVIETALRSEPPFDIADEDVYDIDTDQS